MTVSALWSKHRPIALAIAPEYRIPGLDADDVRQEALVALWEAAGSFDPARGRFPAFARTVIHRHLRDLLQAATRMKRTAVFHLGADPADTRDRIAARLELVDYARRATALSDRERSAVTDHVRGVPAKSTKAHDSALQRARRKLKAAA